MKNQKKPQQKTTEQLLDDYNFTLAVVGNDLGLKRYWSCKRYALTYFSNYLNKRVIIKFFETQEEGEKLLKKSIIRLENLSEEIYKCWAKAIASNNDRIAVRCEIQMETIEHKLNYLSGCKVVKLNSKEGLIDNDRL